MNRAMLSIEATNAGEQKTIFQRGYGAELKLKITIVKIKKLGYNEEDCDQSPWHQLEHMNNPQSIGLGTILLPIFQQFY